MRRPALSLAILVIGLIATPVGAAVAGDAVDSPPTPVPGPLQRPSGEEDVLLDVVNDAIGKAMDCTDNGIIFVGTTCEPNGSEPWIEVGPIVVGVHDRVFEEECRNLPSNPTISRVVCAAFDISTTSGD